MEDDCRGDEGCSAGEERAYSLWRHLPLLLRSSSKDSVEYILQALWRTRATGLDSADRTIFRDILQLHSDGDLDPLLVCLRMLIRRCVYGDVRRDEIQKLFPEEVTPELQRLLTLLLQRFQSEWREDANRDKVSIPRLKAVTCNMVDQNSESGGHVAVLNLKLQGEARSLGKDTEVKVQLTKDSLQTMLKSMFNIRDQFSTSVSASSMAKFLLHKINVLGHFSPSIFAGRWVFCLPSTTGNRQLTKKPQKISLLFQHFSEVNHTKRRKKKRRIESDEEGPLAL